MVGVGAFDAHMGAVGGQIEPYHLSKVMGTSTCDMLVAPPEEVSDILVSGICGQVPGSIIPGMIGMEAGQSAFGDAYAWFKNMISWPLQNILSQSELLDADTIKKRNGIVSVYCSIWVCRAHIDLFWSIPVSVYDVAFVCFSRCA